MALSTLHLVADPDDIESSRDAIERAAVILRAGGTVAFPTETVYGLGAHALDTSAVSAIFAAKKRPSWDPLIVHIADSSMLGLLVVGLPAGGLPAAAQAWMEHFWPGPLTLLLPRSVQVPDAVTAGRSKVGVRVPRHPVAQALLREAGIPVAAPSANLFGHVSPTTAAHVRADLDDRVDAILDGGPCEHGLESTVVDAETDPCVLYRPGAISLEALAAVWPRIVSYREPYREALSAKEAPESLPSPGVGIRHYAPAATLVLIEHGALQAAQLREALLFQAGSGRTGVLLPEGLLRKDALPPGVQAFAWGEWSRPETMAHVLFAGLRSLDADGVSRIVCPLPAAEGVGAAICDRLRKAARPR